MPPLPVELRVLVLAPTQRDAEITLRFLSEAQIIGVSCASPGDLLKEIEAGAGAVILTDEVSRARPVLQILGNALNAQPPWSDLPIIVLARTEPASTAVHALRALPGLVLLERPVQSRTFLSAVQAALRARVRQYELREQLAHVHATNLELEEATRAKDEFLATLSHELRNPMNALTAALRVLDHAEDKPAKAAIAREIIGRQAEQMTHLLDDLLDISHITRRRLEIRKTATEIQAIVSAAIETASPLLKSKGHTLNVVLPSEPLRLDADPVRLAQVITNLLTNAAKYTERGGVIALHAVREKDELVLSVRDNGIGIPADSLDKIFRMFSQLRPAIQRSEGGLGIGLALARGLVELHGGTISARSDGPGAGSEFVVRIPLGAAFIDAPQAREESASAVKRHLLIADDNADSLEALATLLEIEGHTVRTAHDGPEALALAMRHRPDTILLDIGMPQMNGYEVARRVRRENPGYSVTLIALTGWGQARDKALAHDAGFDHHLTKPVNIDRLRALLASLANTPS
jgi:two-component system, sensor histidine kinase